jgi:hypothetical protein
MSDQELPSWEKVQIVFHSGEKTDGIKLSNGLLVTLPGGVTAENLSDVGNEYLRRAIQILLSDRGFDILWESLTHNQQAILPITEHWLVAGSPFITDEQDMGIILHSF